MTAKSGEAVRKAALAVVVLLFPLLSCGDRSASIEGKVLLPDLENHEGTQVYLPGTPYQAITDREGRFYFPDIRTGDYELVARREGFGEYRKTGIRARPGSPLRLIPFTLERGDLGGEHGTVEGVVGLADGASPLGTLVIVENVSRLTATDSEGRFSLPGLKPGDYSLVAVKPGYVVARRTAEVIAGATTTLEPLTLAVAGGAVPAGPPGRIEGRVTVVGGSLQAGVLVTVEGTSLVASTDPDGAFSIAQVPSGTYAVRFQKDQFFPYRQTNVVVEPDGEVALEATLRPIPSSNLFSTISQVENIGGLRGYVGVPGGVSPGGTEVVLDPLGLAAETQADGGYSFPVVPEGIYTISARREGYRTGTLVGIRVEAGKETVSPQLVLEAVPAEELPPEPSGIEGTVLLEGETIHLGILVALVDTQYTALTGSDGRFRFEGVTPGEYPLLAVKEGFEPVEVPVEAPSGRTLLLRPITLPRKLVRPAILDTEPRDGERDVPVNDYVQIVIQFDQRMDGAAVKRSFRISPNVEHRTYFGGEKGAEAFRTMGPGYRQDFDAQLFLRSEEPPAAHDRLVVRLLRYGKPPVALEQTYRVTIGDEARNLEGVPIAEPYQFTFSTGGARLIASWPEDGAKGVFLLEDDALVFDFNTKVDRKSFEEGFRIRPKTDSVPLFLPERVPSGDRVKVEVALRESTDYTVEIGRSVRAADGGRMDNLPYRIRFETASIEDVGDDYEDLFEGEWNEGSSTVDRHLRRREARDQRHAERRASRQQEQLDY